jgi:hypothetical protein
MSSYYLHYYQVFGLKDVSRVPQRPDRRMQELQKWGYKCGGSAEACAEATSTVNQDIPLLSLALRRFRTEFIEPLLLEIQRKDKKKTQPVTIIVDTFKPQGQLGHVVTELLETKCRDEDEMMAGS